MVEPELRDIHFGLAGFNGIAAVGSVMTGDAPLAALNGGFFLFNAGLAVENRKEELASLGERGRERLLAGYYDRRMEGRVEQRVRSMDPGVVSSVDVDEQDLVDLAPAASTAVRKEFLEEPYDVISDGADRIAGTVEELAAMRYGGNLDMEPGEIDELEPVYAIDTDVGRPVSPTMPEEMARERFLRFCEDEIGGRNGIDMGYARTVLEEGDGTVEELEDRFDLQPNTYDAMEAADDPVETGVMEELVQTLYGQVLNRGDGFKDTVEAVERSVKKVDPEPYEELVENEHGYTVRHLTDPAEMQEAARAGGSCIRTSEEYFETYADDPETLYSALQKDGEMMGYMRSFVMQDDEGKQFLAVDTIEVDHKNFEENDDVVRAAGLASIQMGYDLELDYVAGSDARVRYGPRQAYGNTRRNLSFEKEGESDVYTYGFSLYEGEGAESAYLLMENPSP